MRKLILLIALATLSVPALAATAQQEKMKTCNAEAKAKGLKGNDYKKFRDDCLKAKPATPAAAGQNASPAAEQKTLTPQQEKMKKCNGLASSQGLKGDARNKFMSGCLKG
jgi:hypothetical protein